LSCASGVEEASLTGMSDDFVPTYLLTGLSLTLGQTGQSIKLTKIGQSINIIDRPVSGDLRELAMSAMSISDSWTLSHSSCAHYNNNPLSS